MEQSDAPSMFVAFPAMQPPFSNQTLKQSPVYAKKHGKVKGKKVFDTVLQNDAGDT